MSFFDSYKNDYVSTQPVEMTFREYLEGCKHDTGFYSTAAQRILKAIGEPKIIDTREDERLSRLFQGRRIKVYEAFKDFYGMETVVEEIVSFFQAAAMGLENARQLLYLCGPVGSAKSSLVEKLKTLMEKEPIYVLKAFNKAIGYVN